MGRGVGEGMGWGGASATLPETQTGHMGMGMGRGGARATVPRQIEEDTPGHMGLGLEWGGDRAGHLSPLRGIWHENTGNRKQVMHAHLLERALAHHASQSKRWAKHERQAS